MESVFSTPMHSKDDVLLEEIQYLRQMLADCNEEKKIQVAIIRDELAEKQRTIDVLMKAGDKADGHAPSCASVQDYAAAEHRRAAEEQRRQLELQRADVDRREEEMRRGMRAQEEREWDMRRNIQQQEVRIQELEQDCDNWEEATREFRHVIAELTRRIAGEEVELRSHRARMAWWEAKDEVLYAKTTEKELLEWERDVRKATQATLVRIADRRVEVRVAEQATSASDGVLCKICYDRPSSCALLPCRHHAFCRPCAARVEKSREAACPLCRTSVTGIFETFSA